MDIPAAAPVKAFKKSLRFRMSAPHFYSVDTMKRADTGASFAFAYI
jgi:hypothetical protein